VSQFPKRLRLNLTNSLSCEIVYLTHLFKCMIRIYTNAIAHTEQLFFPWSQGHQHVTYLLWHIQVNDSILGCDNMISDRLTCGYYISAFLKGTRKRAQIVPMCYSSIGVSFIQIGLAYSPWISVWSSSLPSLSVKFFYAYYCIGSLEVRSEHFGMGRCFKTRFG